MADVDRLSSCCAAAKPWCRITQVKMRSRRASGKTVATSNSIEYGKCRQANCPVRRATKQCPRPGRADTLEITELNISRQHFVGAPMSARIQSRQIDE